MTNNPELGTRCTRFKDAAECISPSGGGGSQSLVCTDGFSGGTPKSEYVTYLKWFW